MSDYWPEQARQELRRAFKEWKKDREARELGSNHFWMMGASGENIRLWQKRSAMRLLKDTLVICGFDHSVAQNVANDMSETETRAWVRGDFWPRVAALTVKHAMTDLPDSFTYVGSSSSISVGANITSAPPRVRRYGQPPA